MTRKERLLCLFKGDVPDRAAIKVWGADPFQKSPIASLEPVRQLAIEKTDLVVNTFSDFNLYCGNHSQKLIESCRRPAHSRDWVEMVSTYHTPQGDLQEVFLESTSDQHGYQKEYLLKEPNDIKKLLSMPYDPYLFSAASHFETEKALGDRGIPLFSLDNAMYGLARLIGSENFGLWSYDFEDLMLDAIELFSSRLCDIAKTALSHGIRGVYGWVGPELCIPPLMSPESFDTYCYGFDKKLIDIIHGGGAHVWVHCHGKMKQMISRFVDMGVDVLNPIEPPPMGDMTIHEAFEAVGDRMALEGNIETHDIMVGTTRELERKIHDALDAGLGKRLILCPCAGYLENFSPSEREIENWLFFINESVRYAREIVK